jgi:phosphatidate phosphatase APP1
MADHTNRIAALAGAIEARIDALRRRLDDRWGQERITIAAYHGFGTPERLWLRGRVLEESRARPPSDDDSVWRNLANMYHRFDSDEIPGAQVIVRCQGAELAAVADAEGYFEIELAPPVPPPAGQLWQTVDLELAAPLHPSQAPVRAVGRVLLPSPGAQIGMISDIDDTVIRTDATSLLRMIRSVLLANARTRLPFPGVAALYRALHSGADGPFVNPLFYVSSSPWNIFDLLADSFEFRGIPAGPILLRDWGFGGAAGLPTHHRVHKLAAITRIIDTYPALPFVLLGDSGQEDPEIYREVVARYPRRILAIYIRDVTRAVVARGAAIAALAEQVRADGSELLLADDSLAVARHASDRGWIAAGELDEVAAAVAYEQQDDGATLADTGV